MAKTARFDRSQRQQVLFIQQSRFYHNLINLTDEWLVLVLGKKLNLTKDVDYSLIDNAGRRQRKVLRDLAKKVNSDGDGIFKNSPVIVKRIYSMDPHTSIPALITLLNLEERGKHEQCTIFAIILGISRKHPSLALKLLRDAEKGNTAQPYYLQELIKKVGQH